MTTARRNPPMPAQQMRSAADLPTYHLATYIAWLNGGKTECCRVPVDDLSKRDVCGPPGSPPEPGHKRCQGHHP